MPRKSTLPHDDPEQSKRFIDTAREIEADESRDAFNQTFKKIVHVKGKPKPRPDRT